MSGEQAEEWQPAAGDHPNQPGQQLFFFLIIMQLHTQVTIQTSLGSSSPPPLILLSLTHPPSDEYGGAPDL